MRTQAERLPTRVWALAGALLFLGLFWAFLRSSPADLYLDDSGETVTVAARLGLSHPPGYPIHTLIAHELSTLPWASPAWRVNLLAVLCGALCATALGLGALRVLLPLGLGSALTLASALAVLLAAGPVYWHNALGAKGSIYQLNNVFSVLLLGLLAWEPSSARRLRAFTLLLGLALAHHYMSQLPLLPAYAWLLWRQRHLRLVLREAWLLLPGILLYGYLPLRWQQHPDLAWGSFASWKDFWFYFFRLQYAAAELTRSAATTGVQAWHALGLIWREGAGILVLLAAAGAWQGRRKPWIQALGLGWLASLLSVALYLNLKAERLDLMQPYLFPAYLCQAGLAIEGTRWLFTHLALKWRLAAAGLALAGALALGTWRWPTLSLSQYYFASDNAESVLQALPRNALLLAQGDAIIFPLWYRQRVLRERPDVAVVGLAVLPMDWVREDLARWHPDLRQPQMSGPIGAESVPRLTEAYLALNQHRPLYAAFNKLDPPLPGWRLQSEGQVWHVLPESEPSGGAPARAAALQRLSAGRLRGFTQRPLDERTLSLIVGDRAVSYNSLGVEAEESAPAEALAYYALAERMHPESPDYAFNQGNALYALGRRPEALAAFVRSVAVDPHYVNGWYNLGVTSYQMGQIAQAKHAFGQASALAPERQDLRQLLQQLGP
jgi:tetratricopeptide (TPR) repeat protein